jgi:hypothetical protein
MKKILFGVLPLFFLFGCSSFISRYFFSYEQIDKSSKHFIQKDELYAGYNHYFEDDLFKLHIDCEPYEIRFYIINKTNNPLHIIWDSVKVYSEYLSNNSVSITHSNKTQANIVIPDSSASDFIEKNILIKMREKDSLFVIKPSIILANHTWMDEIQFNKNEYLLPYQLSNKDSLNDKSTRVIGKKIKLLLPIKIKEEIKNYTFLFSVKGFQILSIN